MQNRPAYAPTHFAGRSIKFTIPYTMPGELIVPASTPNVQFPEGQFLHTVDKPFEIWRMIARVGGMFLPDGSPPNTIPTLLDPQPETMEDRVRLSIRDVSKNEDITKNPQLVSSMQKLNERTWEWDPRPYTIVRQEGLKVTASADVLPLVCYPDLFAATPACDLAPLQLTHVKVNVTFQGWLLILEPPSESR